MPESDLKSILRAGECAASVVDQSLPETSTSRTTPLVAWGEKTTSITYMWLTDGVTLRLELSRNPKPERKSGDS